jgi:hypothetical protein
LRPVILGLVVAVLVPAVWFAVRSTGAEAGDGGGGAAVAAASSSLPGPAASGGVAPATEAAAPVPEAPEAVPGSAAEWAGVVAVLYGRRAEAFATASPDLLESVYAHGSPLLAADAEHARALADAGEVLRGFAPTVGEVREASRTGDRVQLHLVDRWPGYEVVSAARPEGPAVRTAPGRPAAAVRMVLVRAGDGWLIESAERTA